MILIGLHLQFFSFLELFYLFIFFNKTTLLWFPRYLDCCKRNGVHPSKKVLSAFFKVCYCVNHPW